MVGAELLVSFGTELPVFEEVSASVCGSDSVSPEAAFLLIVSGSPSGLESGWEGCLVEEVSTRFLLEPLGCPSTWLRSARWVSYREMIESDSVQSC